MRSGAVLRTADPDEFVYDPDAAARSRTDLRAFALLGATLLAGGLLLVAAVVLAPSPPAGRAAATRGAAAPARAIRSRCPEAAAARTAMPRTRAPVNAAPEPPAPTDVNAVLTRLERTMRQRVPRRVASALSLLPELWRVPGRSRRRCGHWCSIWSMRRRPSSKASGDLVVGTRNFAFTEARSAATPGAQLGEYVRVTVRDNGPGLSDEALDQVFDAAATAPPCRRAGGRDDAAARRLCPGRERRGRRHRRPSVFSAAAERRRAAGNGSGMIDGFRSLNPSDPPVRRVG